jgi:uncharacterized protein
MFNSADKTYEAMPKSLSTSNVLTLVGRVEDYYIAKNLKEFKIILHGGEPFLWELDRFKAFFERINLSRKKNMNIVVSIQTNLFKINKELLLLLDEHNVKVGVSIDGPQNQHDKFRVTHNGKPTYRKIMDNLSNIIDAGFGHCIGGFLTVSDPTIPAHDYFEWIKSLPIKNVNVLWPIEFNYNHTPWEYYHLAEEQYLVSPVYGRWFSELFNIWWANDNPAIAIRMFYEIISNMLGSKRHSDSIVNDQLSMCVVNTDGSFEYHDYFRAFKDSAVKTGYNVNTNTFADLENDHIIKMLFSLKDFLPSNCTDCKHKLICGGGFLPGRMENHIADFKTNNSVLCYDYYYLFDTITKALSGSANKKELAGNDYSSSLLLK